MGGIVHSEMSPPILIISQESAPQTCQQTNLLRAFSQLWYPLMTVAYSKLMTLGMMLFSEDGYCRIQGSLWEWTFPNN